METNAPREPSEEGKRAQELSRELDEWLDEESLETTSDPIWPTSPSDDPDPWGATYDELPTLEEFTRETNGHASGTSRSGGRTSKTARTQQSRDQETSQPSDPTQGQGGA